MMMDHDCDLRAEVFQLRDEFLNMAACIATRYGTGKVSERTVVKLLMEHLCERCIVEKLRLGYWGENDIDRVWRNLHDYAVMLLVERLKNELVASGLPIKILSEAENPVGRYDVLLMVDGKGIQIVNGDSTICLEAKTGLNVSLSQTEKYMWNGITIILIRFAMGDVIKLKAKDWVNLLKFALKDRIEKAKRLLNGRAILVPCADCKGCPLKDCRFNKNVIEVHELIKPHSLNDLFKSFRENAYFAIEAAVKAVIDELSKALQSEVVHSYDLVARETSC
jgi:hypothetical protein